MITRQNNYAFIDGANLHKGVHRSGWELDYLRFRIWLREKYGVTKAYLFVEFISEQQSLYDYLYAIGYILVYKETIKTRDGLVKGNCDADMVLSAVVAFFEKRFDAAVVVTSDGDFASLVKFFKEKNALAALVSPDEKCSYLLRKIGVPVVYLSTQKHILELK